MFQRRSHRTAPRPRSLALGGAVAALAVVAGGTLVAVSAPDDVAADILLTQNASDADSGPRAMPLGAPVEIDLEPVVAGAAGGAVPAGTTVQVTGLPDGLTQEGLVISGTPTRAGDYDVLVTVSNGEQSRSQRVAIQVVDLAGAGDEGADERAGDDSRVGAQPDPTLSAVPGDPARAGDGGGADGGAGGETVDEVDEGIDDDTGVADLCAGLGDGGLDSASLTRLLPGVAGDDESAASGLVTVLVDAVLALLPSVLGEDGSSDLLGTAGGFLCTLAPSLLGGSGAGDGGPTAPGADATGSPAVATAQPAGAGTGGVLPALEVSDPVSAALLGVLTSGAGGSGE